MRKAPGSLLLGLLLSTACASYSTEADTAAIRGSWSWVRSDGGIAGRSLTPASEHYSVEFRFESGKIIALRNDSMKATSRYSASDESVFFEPGLNVFLFDPQIEQSKLTLVSADTISLADPCCDRYSHIFTRKR